MRRSNADLDKEVAALGDLSREQLGELWQKAYGHPPPKGIRQELLLRSVTWHLQAKRLGGLRPDTRRMLKTAMADAEGMLLVKVAAVSPTRENIARSPNGSLSSAIGAGAKPQSNKM